MFFKMNDDNRRIILFDGVCNFCSRFIQFIVRHDSRAKIKFAALQAETGLQLIKQSGLVKGQTEFIVYLTEGKYFIKSMAILKILKELDGVWKLGYGFVIVPKFLRDFFYDFIAKRRYKLFGRMNSCLAPLQGIKERFPE